MLSDQQLLRYSRQIMLPEVDYQGQQRLADSCVLVIGAGGLGSPVAMYLAAAGVGQLIIVDDDQVELSNLQRQLLHSDASIGVNKALSAQARLQQINPHCQVSVQQHRLAESELTALLQQGVAAIVDCSDNFETRYLLNQLSRQQGIPLISGAAIGWQGQVAVFNQTAEAPCYRCLYPEGEQQALKCAEAGVIAPLVGIIGSVQALETLKVLVGCGETLSGALLVLDGLSMQWRRLKLSRDPHCPDCH